MSEEELRTERETTLDALRKRRDRYREKAPRIPPEGRTVILVDDGVATGATILACIQGLRREGAARIVAAVPVAPAESLDTLERAADRVVCPHSIPGFFGGIGGYYRRFDPVSDEEAMACLRASRA